MSFERIEPGTREWTQYHAEHLQRYMFAAHQIAAASVSGPVLDVACGVGYGSHYLADATGAEIVGVDRDARALELAAQRFSSPRITFQLEDCHSLERSGARGPFRAIVSLETIEHLVRPGEFLARCFELLAPGGVLVVSTPNARVSSLRSGHWDFHEKEYTATELTALLAEAGFVGSEVYGQQATALGRLRDQVRSEVNTLRSNPFMRIGWVVQRLLRGRPYPGPPLPAGLEDYEIGDRLDPKELDMLGAHGPAGFLAVVRV